MVIYNRPRKIKVCIPLRKIIESNGEQIEELHFRYIEKEQKFGEQITELRKIKKLARNYGYGSNYKEFQEEVEQLAKEDNCKDMWEFIESGKINDYMYKNSDRKEKQKSKINYDKLNKLLESFKNNDKISDYSNNRLIIV